MATKLKKVELCGFRGAKAELTLSFPSAEPLLLYGDNGSGKSTLTDGIEWFYSDRVDHLASEEIGRNGIPALRNRSLQDDEDASVAIEYTDTALSATKTLSIRSGRLTSEYSNPSAEFSAYREASAGENLILRYRDLLRFVLFTKTRKLEELSKIIGFGAVTTTKATLKKAANDLRRLEKIKDYDGQTNRRQADIIEQLGQNVTTEEQFVVAAKDILASLDLGVEVNDTASLNRAVEQAKSPADDEIIQRELSYGNVLDALTRLRDGLEPCASAYVCWQQKRATMLKDERNLASLGVERLLSEGMSVLDRSWDQDSCPLCLQTKSREELVEELRARRSELSGLRKEYEELEEAKSAVVGELSAQVSNAESALEERCLEEKGCGEIKEGLEKIKSVLTATCDAISSSTLGGGIDFPTDLSGPELSGLGTMISAIGAMKESASKQRHGDERFKVIEKLSLAKKAYEEISLLRDERAAVRRQLESMECIYREFVRREHESLSQFLVSISTDLNELYLFMNPGERIESIRLVPVGDADGFVGVTLEMTFEGEVVSPPEKYLSESYINSLGICLFLASVRAFNEKNRFFILDDVISSFDSEHRVRFGHLLQEQFAGYQIVLFTHERNWFDYMASLVKGRGWTIRRVAWDAERGAVTRPAPVPPRATIADKLLRSDEDGLGNAMRIYLEDLLKKVCLNLAVKLEYRRNDRNEERMAGELLSGLIGTIKKLKCELKEQPVLKRLLNSSFIANKASHHNKYIPPLGDLKAVWRDIVELESLLVCGSCSKPLDIRKRDAATGAISCACGKLVYKTD